MRHVESPSFTDVRLVRIKNPGFHQARGYGSLVELIPDGVVLVHIVGFVFPAQFIQVSVVGLRRGPLFGLGCLAESPVQAHVGVLCSD